MSDYTVTQWILFFFWYCFLGWIWECFFVSVKGAWKQKRWKFVNRGFLHGPLIPIYGFAAVSILLVTIPVREHTALVYVMGALTATVFELVTGTAMERLFRVKYWDYSDLPLNYHGHICLFVSMFWGVFAVLLVQVIHVPVERILVKIPRILCEIVAFLMMAVTAYDTAVSFNEAMDLQDLLESLGESNQVIQKLERRMDAVVAFTAIPDREDLGKIKRNAKEAVLSNVEGLRKRNVDRLNRLKDRLQLPEFAEGYEREELLELIEQQLRKIFSRGNKQYLHALSQLRRNPGMISRKHSETLETLKRLLKKRD